MRKNKKLADSGMEELYCTALARWILPKAVLPDFARQWDGAGPSRRRRRG